jgi:hypothetical protein
MNIVRSHNYHVRNCSIADPEFFEDPAYLHESADCMTDFQSVTNISEYRYQECREVRNDADILAMETYKLSPGPAVNTKVSSKFSAKTFPV